jgi:predicted PurR-regulated permease PerM
MTGSDERREREADPAAHPAQTEVPPPDSPHVPPHEEAPAGRERGDNPLPFGRPGARISRSSPFYLGFFGAFGVFIAWALANMVVNARSVVVLVVVAIYLAIGLSPLVEFLVRRRVKRGLAVLVVFVLVIAVFALVAIAIVPLLTDQINGLITQAPTWLDGLQRNERIRELDQQYQIIEKLQGYITNGDLWTQVFGGLVGVGRVVLGAVFSGFTLLVLTLYFLASLPRTKKAVYQLIPRSRRERVTKLGDEIIDRIGAYVGGQLLVAGLAAGSSFLFTSIAGLGEYSVALAIMVGVLGMVPMIGGLLGAAIVTAIGFVSDLKIGIACAIFYLLYQQFENYFIYPRVMQRAVSVPGTISIVAAMLGGSMLGLTGALLAIPTAAALLLIIREVIVPRQERT